LIQLNESDTCCGFGGIFSVVYPEVSKAMMETKVKNILAGNAEVVVVSEPGCLVNIRGGLVKVVPVCGRCISSRSWPRKVLHDGENGQDRFS